MNLLPKVQKPKATEFNSTQIHTRAQKVSRRDSSPCVLWRLLSCPRPYLTTHMPSFSRFSSISPAVVLTTHRGHRRLKPNTHTHWTCRVRSGRNMTRSPFINLAHWRNTKSSHSWGEREWERKRRGWSRGCGWWRAGIRKTKQCNGKKAACSAFPRAGFAQAQLWPWTVVNGYFSPLISHSLSHKSLPPHTFRQWEQPPPHTHWDYARMAEVGKDVSNYTVKCRVCKGWTVKQGAEMCVLEDDQPRPMNTCYLAQASAAALKQRWLLL